MSDAKRIRVVASDKAGYGPGRWVAQYFDREVNTWFDIGDPCDVQADAWKKATAYAAS